MSQTPHWEGNYIIKIKLVILQLTDLTVKILQLLLEGQGQGCPQVQVITGDSCKSHEIQICGSGSLQIQVSHRSESHRSIHRWLVLKTQFSIFQWIAIFWSRLSKDLYIFVIWHWALDYFFANFFEKLIYSHSESPQGNSTQVTHKPQVIWPMWLVETGSPTTSWSVWAWVNAIWVWVICELTCGQPCWGMTWHL